MVTQSFTRFGVERGAGRLRHGVAEHMRRKFVTQGCEQCQLSSIRHARSFKIAGDKVSAHALVSTIKQLAIHPFKVHRQSNGFAHTDVFEFRQAGVEHEPLKVTRIAMLELALHQLTVDELFARVTPCPLTCNERLHQIELPRFEALELRSVVFVEAIGNAVKVEQAFAHIQVSRPVVVIALVTHIAAKHHMAYFVRSTANRCVCDDFVQGFRSAIFHAPLTTEDWHTSHDQGQLGIHALEVKAHGSRVKHGDRSDLRVQRAKLRRCLFADESFK